MWIIPSNHPLYSQHASDLAASKEDWKSLLQHYGETVIQTEKEDKETGEITMVDTVVSLLPLMWTSKPSSASTWLSRWNKVWWIRHLSGQILKPSRQRSFTEKYTASLADIPVSHSQLQGKDLEKRIPDTSGPITIQSSYQQLDLFSASLKTSPTTSTLDTKQLNPIWKHTVTRLRKEYSQRKKSAHLTGGNAYLSLLWTTPVASDLNRSTKYAQGGTALSMQVKQWATPRAGKTTDEDLESWMKRKESGDVATMPLTLQVKQWPKPGANEDSYRLKGNSQQSNSLGGLLRREAINTPGKSREQLNPAWVAQLMGTTLEQTFFGCMVMQ